MLAAKRQPANTHLPVCSLLSFAVFVALSCPDHGCAQNLDSLPLLCCFMANLIEKEMAECF